MLTYADIAALHQAGQTADEIAAALADDYRTHSDINIARLAGELLIPTGLYSAIERLRDENAAASQLYDLMRERRIETIRTATSPETAANIRRGFDGLIAGGVLDGLPYTPEQIIGAFYALGGGLRFADVTAAEVQAVIDKHARETRLNNAWLAAQSAHASGADDAAIVAAFGEAMNG